MQLCGDSLGKANSVLFPDSLLKNTKVAVSYYIEISGCEEPLSGGAWEGCDRQMKLSLSKPPLIF